SDWDIASNKSHGSRVSSDATPTFDDMFVCEPDAKTLSDFQRFIRRMEKAGPEIILSHLNKDIVPEDFDHPEREGEIEVERHLWALTALQLQNMENSLVPNQGSQISFLTTKAPLTSIPLPTNVQPLTVPYAGLLPLPYVAASFNHIRAATLPAQLPTSQMKALLRDLFRILAPGGILELRLVEPTPVNKTLGPLFRDWLEDRLLPGLERGTRCHKPLTVIPEWVADAGFHILEGNEDMSPTDEDTEDATARLKGELAALVARGLWKDSWGAFVGEDTWWWDEPEIVRECWEFGTEFECGTMFAFKE
ncbi:hypothetical protein IWX50DRAFT_532860, partial [Phyllosticta citricarpa]